MKNFKRSSLLCIMTLITLPAIATVITPVNFNLTDGQIHTVDKVKCKTMRVSGETELIHTEENLSKNTDKIIYIECDKIFFEQGSILKISSNTLLRSKLLGGHVKIIGNKLSIGKIRITMNKK